MVRELDSNQKHNGLQHGHWILSGSGLKETVCDFSLMWNIQEKLVCVSNYKSIGLGTVFRANINQTKKQTNKTKQNKTKQKQNKTKQKQNKTKQKKTKQK